MHLCYACAAAAVLLCIVDCYNWHCYITYAALSCVMVFQAGFTEQHHMLTSHGMQCVLCCAEDPLWWNETEVALLKGTRLEIAVTEHQKILQKLAYWRDHLVDLERYCGVLYRESVRGSCSILLCLSKPWCYV